MTTQGWDNSKGASSMTHSMPMGLGAEVDLAGGQTLITIESTERMGSQATETKFSVEQKTQTHVFLNGRGTKVRFSGESYPLSNSKLQDFRSSEINSQQQLTFIVEGL